MPLSPQGRQLYVSLDLAGRKSEKAYLKTFTDQLKKQSDDAKDSTIILRGRVRTWAEREEAERAAWGAPGVLAVKDELIVGI